MQKGPEKFSGPFCCLDKDWRLTLATAAARSAATTTTAGTTWATAATAAIVVIRRGAPCANGLSYWNRSAIDTVEVRLGFLIEFLAAFLVKIIATLNQNRALIRLRLTLIEFVAGPDRCDGRCGLNRRRRCFESGRRFFGLARGRLRQLCKTLTWMVTL